jgi:hypothetical protein
VAVRRLHSAVRWILSGDSGDTGDKAVNINFRVSPVDLTAVGTLGTNQNDPVNDRLYRHWRAQCAHIEADMPRTGSGGPQILCGDRHCAIRPPLVSVSQLRG